MESLMEPLENGTLTETSTETSIVKEFTVPDLHDQEACEAFNRQLMFSGKRGAVMARKRFEQARYAHRLLQSALTRLYKYIDRLNGVRTKGETQGDKQRSTRNTAKKFYEGLKNTPALRKHAKLAGINYDMYDSDDDVVSILVEEYVKAH